PPPAVPVGLPAQLLRRRPDIRAAEARLHAATANIGVATADLLPDVSLSASAGLQAVQFHNIFDLAANQWAIGPSLTLPIFEGGKLRAQLRLTRLQAKEAAVNYEKSVLTALTEVDDALTAYRDEQRRRAHLAQAVRQDHIALGLAQARYTQGIASYIEVLDAQRNLLAAEQALSTSTATVSTDLVALYKALGGGWQRGAAPARS
ncbi:MAG: efflux transporter outer membrane subunit, partial [Acetobacteraceae bacterium]